MIIAGYIAAGFLFLLMAGNLFTFVWQDHFIFRPVRLPEAYDFSFEAPFEEVSLKRPLDGRINLLWFRRQKGIPSRGLVLYFHGNSGNLVRWGNLYRYFFGYHYDFLTCDYRGFGKSRGKRTEQLMYEDAEAVYRYARRFYPPEKIVIFGRSVGSAFACRLAAEQSAKMLVLETPFSGMRDLFFTYYPFLPRLFLFKYLFPNRRYLEQVSCPVFIFQGTDDWIVPERCAARLRPLLKPGDAFFRIEMGRHNDLMIYEDYHRRMAEILSDE